MNRTAVSLLGALALGAAPASSPVHAQRVEQGELAAGDQQLDSGEYLDTYAFQGQPGQRVVITLTSQSFDTFLILLSPSGKDTQNDDHEGNNRQSRIEAVLDEAGEWRVGVTSYEGGETGSYTLQMDLGGAAAAAAPSPGPLGGGGKPPRGAAPPAAPAAPMGMGPQTHQGELAQGDETLEAGEYADVYTFQGVAGGRARIELRSNAFDTYLFVVGPDGNQEDNDDASQGETTRSLVEMQTTAGEYRVVVTSYESGETGAYQLTIDAGGGAVPPTGPLGGGAALGGGKPPAARPPAAGPPGGAPGGAGPRVERGRLEQGDQTLDDGEFLDRYTFEGRRGQRVVIDLMSQDFDTYLLLRGPDKQSEDNDDYESDQHHSRIEVTLEEDGTFAIGVTSYRAGQSGNYELRIQISN